MAGLILPARAASGLSVSAALATNGAPHVVMVGAMAFGMVGGHSAARMLAAAAMLVVTSLLCARRARLQPIFREHLADLGAMALVLVALAPGHVDGHAHGILPHGAAGLALIGSGWMLVRALLARGRWHRALPSALVFAVGFALMAMFCS